MPVMVPDFSPDAASKVLANLASIYNGELDYIGSQWYAPFSGQPDADIGALRITYTDGTRALNSTLADTLAGNKEVSAWIDLANTTEQSMRAIVHYSDQASATSEISYVAKQTEQTVLDATQKVTNAVGKGIWATIVAMFKGSPLLVAGVFIFIIAALFVIFKPGIDAATSVVKGDK